MTKVRAEIEKIAIMSDLILRRKLVKFITGADPRNIFGETSQDEAQALKEEGVDFAEFLGWKGTKINIINCIISSFAGYRLIIRSHADVRFDNAI